MSNHSIDHFNKCFQRAFAKVEERRIKAKTDQSNQVKQGDAQGANQTTTIIAKLVVTQRLSDDEYQTSLMSQMKAHLKAKQQTDSQSDNTI